MSVWGHEALKDKTREKGILREVVYSQKAFLSTSPCIKKDTRYFSPFENVHFPAKSRFRLHLSSPTPPAVV